MEQSIKTYKNIVKLENVVERRIGADKFERLLNACIDLDDKDWLEYLTYIYFSKNKAIAANVVIANVNYLRR